MNKFEVPVITNPLNDGDIGGDFSDITILSIRRDVATCSLPDGRKITADAEGNILEIG